MSHLTPDNKNVPTGLGKPFNSLVPPQGEATGEFRSSVGNAGNSKPSLVPPQEEKSEFQPPAGENILFQKGMDVLQEQISKRSLTYEDDDPSEHMRDKVISDSVRAGAAGVTGEDFSVEEKRRIM